MALLAAAAAEAAVLKDQKGFSLSPAGSVTGVAAGPQGLVVAGSFGLQSSRDAITWHWPNPSYSDFQRVRFTGGRYFAVTNWGVAWSTDAVSWKTRQLTHTGWDVACNSVRCVVASRDVIQLSDDLVTWRAVPVEAGAGIVGITWANGLFVAVGKGLYTSADGETWVRRVSGLSTLRVAGVVWTGERFVATAYGKVLTSSDGVAWVVTVVDDRNELSDLVWDGRRLLATTVDGRVLAGGTTGLSWETKVTVRGALYSIAWTGEWLVVGGTNGVLRSRDGTSWAGFGFGTEDVAWGAGVFVVAGMSRPGAEAVGCLLMSPDGTTWRDVTPSGEVPWIRAVAWNGSSFLAIADAATAFASTDGLSWESVETTGLAGLSGLWSLVSGGGRWVVAAGVAGTGSLLLSSEDGAHWVRHELEAGTGVSRVVWAGTRFVAGLWTADAKLVSQSVHGVVWSAPSVAIPGQGGRIAGLVWTGRKLVTTTVPSRDFDFTCDAAASRDGIVWEMTHRGSCSTDLLWTGSGVLGLLARDGLEAQISPDGVFWASGLNGLYPGDVKAALGGARLVVIGRGGGSLASAVVPPAPALTDVAAHRVVVPAVAHTQGVAGTMWTTDLSLEGSGEATIFLLDSLRDNRAAEARRLTLNGSARLTDVVGRVFDRDRATGALVITSAAPILVSARTATAMSGGSFGQHMPGLDPAGATARGGQVRLVHLTRNAGFRTNLGLVSVSAAVTDVRIDLYRASGELLGTRTFALAPFGFFQETDVFAKAGATEVDDGYAVVQPTSVGARLLTYASVIDNASGDPEMVLPLPTSSGEPLFLPAAAHAAGVNGTLWRTDLEVHNPGQSAATFTVELLPKGGSSPEPLSRTYALGPGLSARYGDVVASVFGATGSAALRVTPVSGQVMADARTYNLAPGGTFGQLIAGVPLSKALPAAGSWRLFPLDHSLDPATGFRTNIGFVNPGPAPLAVHVEWAGAPIDLVLPPYSFQQVDRALAAATADVSAASASVSAASAARVLTYASVVDNLSGDPIYVPGR